MPVRPVYWYDVTDTPEQLILLLRCMGSGFLAMVIKSCLLLTKHEHYSEKYMILLRVPELYVYVVWECTVQ